MGWSAFAPQGNTVAIAVTTSASTAVQVKGQQGGSLNYMVSNASSQDCFLAVGPNNSIAAVIPVAGTPANGLYLPANSIQAFTFMPDAWFSAIASTGTSTVYITPGDGL